MQSKWVTVHEEERFSVPDSLCHRRGKPLLTQQTSAVVSAYGFSLCLAFISHETNICFAV